MFQDDDYNAENYFGRAYVKARQAEKAIEGLEDVSKLNY